jgi:undecaprenyl phosphate N,N'-diacetylbacillosamine 1-phosphate transferase
VNNTYIWKAALAFKRVLDYSVSFVSLIVLFPLLALIAIAIKLDSPGPVFFRQERLGQHGRTFRIWKFRTMVVDAAKMGRGLNVVERDPRITKVGRILRRFSLDELPQLINIFRGEMSLVGPRPGLPLHLEIYDDFQKRRLEVKPGLTGPSQVKGRAALSWPERIEMDIDYIDNYSLWLDVSIVLQTFKVLISQEGIYNPKGGGWDLQTLPPSVQEKIREASSTQNSAS